MCNDSKASRDFKQTQRSRSKLSEQIITVREEKENISPSMQQILYIPRVELEYPKNRHADQVCSKFYRMPSKEKPKR